MIKVLNSSFLIISILSGFLIIAGCTDMILEYEYVADLQILELQENGKKYIEISGLCMHSSMNIDKVNYIKDGNSLYVQVLLTLIRKEGSSGNLKEQIEINENIKYVYFGKNQQLIWTVNE